MFSDIPFVKGRSAGDPAKDPNLVVERRMVALLGYPCDVYQGGRRVKVQMIAPVVDATKAGIPPNWDGAYGYFPLPDLVGDGRLYAAELRTAANIDVSYLTAHRRLRSLSRFGWAVFRQRLALSATRTIIPLDALDTIGAYLWQEVEAWQRWCEVRGDEPGFQDWLDQPDPTLSGFPRRRALERGHHRMVRMALEAELSP